MLDAGDTTKIFGRAALASGAIFRVMRDLSLFDSAVRNYLESLYIRDGVSKSFRIYMILSIYENLYALGEIYL